MNINKTTKQQKKSSFLFRMAIVLTPIADLGASGEILLEKILEEDSIYGDDRARETCSPQANDKRHLLGNGHTAVHITRI